MKAKINGIEVEGTPDEIALLLRTLPLGPFGDIQKPQKSQKSEGNWLHEDMAFRILKRRPLSDEVKSVLTLLSRNYPAWTSAIDLQKASGYNPNQLAGLLGAFGKRVASTEGYIEGQSFFEVEWDYDLDCYRYRLPDSSLSAVARAGL